MVWQIGINLRATAGYVTDGTDETYCLYEAYPTTRGGVTFGWSSTYYLGVRDRSSGVDRRVAGLHYWDSGNSASVDFQIDLSQTGEHKITYAYADPAYGTSTSNVYWNFKDNTTTFHTLNAAGTGSTTEVQNIDGTLTSPLATWISSSKPTVTRTFTSTIFKLTSNTTASTVHNVSHINIEYIPAVATGNAILFGVNA